MAEDVNAADAPKADAQVDQLAGQTYEIIRNRLMQHGGELRRRLERLNDERKEVFGSIETELLGTERVTTDNNCTPRDMVAVGDRLLFGYNVHVGLRSQTTLADVFAVYRYGDDRKFRSEPLELIADPQFENDFAELYKYYKETKFAKFAVIGPHLFMVFRVGRNVTDVKTFKWLIEENGLRYLDNRSDHEYRFPPQHEFDWRRTTRDQHRAGLYPHISIEDRLFVETVGGDLTVKIENNTDSGEGIYSEPVDNPDQTLDDAEVYYAIVGNLILLRMRPYQENDFRYIVFNEKVSQACRIDAIADACVLLPDDHGLIFSQGYYLQNGQHKTFDNAVSDMVFEKQIRSPNGEDFLYEFFNRLDGVYVLLSYNLISQEVGTPMICNGYATFHNGEVLTFRHHQQPQKHHAIQIWQTPYTGLDFAPSANTDSQLYKIGNQDLVRGMAECHEVLGLIEKEDSYANLYLDIVKQTTDILDSFFWITDAATENLAEPLGEIREAAQAAISEFEKVVRQRENTRQEVQRVTKRVRELITAIGRERFENIHAFVAALADLRAVRGEAISLRDLKYVEPGTVDKLEQEVGEHTEKLSQRCVDYLTRPEALVPYHERVAEQAGRIEGLSKVAEAKELEEKVAAAANELEMLIEIVSNLKIDDATVRTTIIDNISAIFSRLNQVRAELKKSKSRLMSTEGAAEFASQLKLLNQAVVNYLDVCDTPAKCEEYLTKLMIQVEELEGRFAEFDEMVGELTEKREEIYNAFEARKLQLVEATNRRANTLMKSAERILKGIRTRVEALESVSEINGYFAGDLMVDKLRDIMAELGKMDDSVKVDDIQSQLKTIREDAVRQLKDRQELYVDGQNVLQLGKHKFSVNIQSLDLTTVMRDERMCYHLTGTNFFEPITDEAFLATREVWSQEIVSENKDVYRGEYLAFQILQESREYRRAADDERVAELVVPPLDELAQLDNAALGAVVQKYMAPRYAEGYVKGVHDHDAAGILRAMVEMTTTIGLLRYRSEARALAWLFWHLWDDAERKPILTARLEGFGKVTALFPETKKQVECITELQSLAGEFVEACNSRVQAKTAAEQVPAKAPAKAPAKIPARMAGLCVFDAELVSEAGEYLFYTLAGRAVSAARKSLETHFTVSHRAHELLDQFRAHLESKAHTDEFETSLAAVRRNLLSTFLLARDWVGAFLDAIDADHDTAALRDEVAAMLLEEEIAASRVVHASTVRELTGLVGSHPRLAADGYRLNYNRFMGRLTHFAEVVVPRFHDYTRLKHELVERKRDELRLEEFRPRVLTSFVRNKLIDQVYLPLVGGNLAKQLGTAGETTRTDRMGLLLLISPPGYGKTTLMEYIANRLGLIFMKVNGPAIGHQVTSLDPTEAPNAAAREEMEKLNLALEMGDNVMIYLDDIQHVNTELLQKFISLCDATRKIEGIYKGRTRTYDLRGKKVCVVMAGNPYTESGERFRIPDMLANRADTYNLGEIIGDNPKWFEMSYLENALTSNPTLAPVAGRAPRDVYALINMAESDSQEPVELEGSYSLDELGELVGTMKKLMRVRDIVLSVNREYIRSAGQSDDYRTEPPFQLQGSYRNMNRIAERVSPLMNDAEMRSLIVSQYEQDAQTLTSGAEANLLKFKELMGILTETELARWNDIKKTFAQNVKLRSFGGDDRFAQIVGQMGEFSEGLEAIRAAVTAGVERLEHNGQADQSDPGEAASAAVTQLARFSDHLEALQKAVAEGVSKLSERAGASSPLTNVSATFSPETAELLTKFVSELQMAQRPPAETASASGATAGAAPAEAGRAGPIQVHVVNKVPRLFLSIIREQFRLMQQWMSPLMEVTQENREGLAELQQQLDDAMKNYDEMIDRLEETE